MQNPEPRDTALSMTLLLPLIILIEGFASIAVEILAIRQLLPVAGGSVVVTSLIIGIFLLFLAIGYEKGGRVAQDRHQRLRINFFISAILIGVGLSYLFITFFFGLLQKQLGSHVIYPLIIYLFIIIAPIIYLLGQTLPITMNIVRQNRTAGVIAGKALGLSTIGSFLGAVGTTVVLMHYVGVAITVFIVFLLLMSLVILLSTNRSNFTISLVTVLLASIPIYYMNIAAEKKLFLRTTNFANYQVLDHTNSKLEPGEKILVINDVFSSYTNDNNDAFRYIAMMRQLLFDDLGLQNADILVLGAGGFSLSETDAGNNHFTYVDIDDRISKVVVPAYKEKIKDRLVIDDARHYLHASDKKYDAIVLDVYSDLKSIPAHLLTQQFMLDIRKHLKENGHALFNIIAQPTFADAYSKRIDNTIRSVFGNCVVVPISYGEKVTNLVYSCYHGSNAPDTTIYTDNLNNSATDSFTW